MILRTGVKIFLMAFLLILPFLGWGKNLYFIQEKNLAKDVVSMKVRDFNRYVGLVFLQKSGKNFVLKLQTYLEDQLLTEIELERFPSGDNIHFDFAVDANTLYLVYQNAFNKIIYQKVESIYSKPITVRKDILSQEDGRVYSVPSLYRMGKKIYVFYHKESDKNKLDIQLRLTENGSDFTPAFNLTENLGYAIYPRLVVLRDRLGVFFQGREQDSQGKIYFDIFYHQLNLEGNTVLSKHKLTEDMGDNFAVQGFFLDNRYFLTWENRLNSWRIFYSALDLISGKMLISPQMLTSTFYNYRKPRLASLGNQTYLLVQRMESGVNDQLYAYEIFQNGSISSEMATGINLTEHAVVTTNTIWLFALKDGGMLSRREIDRFAAPVKLVPYFAEREVFSLKNLKIQWNPIQDESGVEGLYYAFDRNPNTIPDEFSKMNPATQSVSLYAPEDGTWYFHLYYQDKAGNKSPVLHKKIVIDTSIPQTPSADFSANEVLDPVRNLIDNTENITVQWKPSEGSDHYLYALSLYPRFFPHTAKNIKESVISFNSLKPGKYFFHLQAVNGAGTRGEVISTPFYVKKITDAPDTFFEPGTQTAPAQKIYIRQILVKNINLIPLRPYLFGGKTPYRIIPFWEMPVTLKLKVAITAALIFLLVFLLYLILFARHKKLIFAYETLKKTPLRGDSSIHALEDMLEGEITVLPGIGDLMIANMSEDRRLKYRELIQRAEHLDKDIHKLEKELEQKIHHTGPGLSAVQEAQLIEQTLEEAEEFIHEAEEVLCDEILSPEFEEISDAEEPHKILDAEIAEEIDEAEEINEIQDAESLEEVEDAGELEEAEEIEEAHEISDAEEADEITEAEEFSEAEEAEEAQELEEAEEFHEEAQEADVIQEPEEIEIQAEEVSQGVLAEETRKQPEMTREVQNPKEKPEKIEKPAGPSAAEIKKEFRERIKLKLKYSFLITILVMFTVGAGSLVNGYFSLKQIKETLSIENIKRAEIAVKTLSINTRDPLRLNDDALIVDAIANAKSIEDVLYSQVVKRDIDINTGESRWFYRDHEGSFKMLEDDSMIQKLMNMVNQTRGAKVLIEPEFTLSNVLKEYTLYYPVLFVKDQNYLLTEKDFGTRFLGVARINFSTARIFEILDEQQSQIFNLTLIVAAAMIGIGLLGAILLAYFTVKPISRLVKGVQIVGGGDLTHQIEITTHDEIGRLTYEFNKMTSQLLVAQEESIKKKVLEEQFSIAEGIQKSLIPQENLMLKDVEIAGFYQAALGVGGDYYDFFEIDKDRVGVVLSDVAGKGIPAALMMVNIRTVFKTNIKKPNITPKEIINILNNVLAEDLANDMFATLFFFIFNRKTREAVYCNAGHGPFTYYSHAQKKVIQPPTARTMPLGVSPDNPQYVNEKFTLAPGDLILVYTDGISEAMDMNHEEYGEPRLFDTLAKLGQSGKSTEEIAQGIIDDVEEFVGEAPQSDDISMVLMKVK